VETEPHLHQLDASSGSEHDRPPVVDLDVVSVPEIKL
jgi:hypothetical protein